MQRVVCGRRYHYDWDGDEPLAVGDIVVTESSAIRSLPRWEVTSLEATYAGPCKRVLYVVEKAEEAES